MEAGGLRRLTIEEYLAIDASSLERWEFIDGEVFEMHAARVEHNIVTGHLGHVLGRVFEGRPCVVLGSQQRIARADRGFFYPDVVVVCGPIARHAKDHDTITNPSLVVEVLSPTTKNFDRSEKFDHYRHLESLTEIVFVSIERREIERRRRTVEGEWVSRWFTSGSFELTSVGVTLTCEDVFAKLPDVEERPVRRASGPRALAPTVARTSKRRTKSS